MFNFILLLYISFIYIFFCYKGKKIKKNNLFLAIVFISLFILVGFRSYSMGNDTITYVRSFENAITYKWNYLDMTRFEKGFVLFEILLGFVTKEPRLFIIITSFIFNFSVYKFIKKYSDNYYLSVIMYVCLLFFYSSMTAMRQFFAVIIILYAYKYIKRKQLIPFVILVLVATTFHITSIICIVLYPMSIIGFSRKKSIILIMVSLLILESISVVSVKFSSFLGWDYTYGTRTDDFSLANFLYFVTFFTMFLVSMWLYKRNKITNKENEFYIYVLLFSALINLIAIKMNILSRASEYFTIFSIIALPNIINSCCSKKEIINFNIVIVILLVLYSTIIIKYRPEWNSSFNYKFQLNNTENIEYIRLL